MLQSLTLCDLIAFDRHDDLSLDLALEPLAAFGRRDEVIVARAAAIARSYGFATLLNKGDKSKLAEFISIVDRLIIPPANLLTNQCLGTEVHHKKRFRKVMTTMSNIVQHLNSSLNEKPFILGSDLTFADIALFCALLDPFILVLHPALLQPCPNVVRWFERVLYQPEVWKIVGSVSLCQKPAQFDPVSGHYLQQDADVISGDVKSMTQEEEEVPLARLDIPLSSSRLTETAKNEFSLVQFRRMYFNKSPLEAIGTLWLRLSNFSIWHCQFKYPEKLDAQLASCDLIHGMVNRLNSTPGGRFASMCLFGEHSPFAISGVWILKGQSLLFKQESADDYSNAFDWRKLDPENEETKTMVREYLTLKGDFNGQTLSRGIIFR